ncbi:hypothetical protein BGZ80_001302 [Entomortierella chlamydospora]|uniref:Peptidase A1 domain-containing protein n=1 Tax=Entomortierella chlamydospora TaxID=101097 RepID=A0A9P6MRS5_9FUNG|nr:hypothetical protein BGZ80_001302 [Entomortierella chlamydospora]
MKCDCNNLKCSRYSRSDPSSPSTITELKTPRRINYGGDDSSVSGHLAIDRVEFSDIIIENQLLGLVDCESSSLDGVVDGVFGLGFLDLSALALEDLKAAETRAKSLISNTVLTSLLTHELIPAPVFGVWLGNGGDGSSSSTDPNAGDGEFIFGSIDTSRYVGDLTFLSITHRKYWQAKVDGVKMDKNSDLAISGDTIIDTGTTLLVMPITQAKQVNRAIGTTSDPWEHWILPCNSNSKGTLDFEMGGSTFSVR